MRDWLRELCSAQILNDNLPVSSELSRAMNDAVIRRLAGDRSYQRGVEYYRHGHVESFEEDAGRVRAVVRGNDDYTVELSSDEGLLDYSCDCPHGSEGAFCKHCVATALACLHRPAELVQAERREKVKEVTLADAKKILLAEKKEEIVGTLLEWAKTDDRLRKRLILHAARRSGAGTGVAEIQKAFDKAVRVRHFVHYREMPSYARGMDDAIDSVEQLLRDGQPVDVIELCESALRSLTAALGSVDDSDGYMGGFRDRLVDIHYRACEEARPEPVALAGRLFHWELHNDFDVFFGAAYRYADILGPKGMEAYRKLAAAEWKKVPARTANDRTSDWGNHFRITRIMETLARLSGDPEALVAVMSRNLSHAYNYLRIAEIYHENGQHDKALEWAEQGLKAFPERTDRRLREFAAEEYHRRRRHDDAMNLMWAAYVGHPGLERYRTLEQHANKAGNWKEWRERALLEIRNRIESAGRENRKQNRLRWMQLDDDHSPLVEIFLYEHEVEAAWREAQLGGCSAALWLRLAEEREGDHPEDAVPIYLQQAEVSVTTTRNSHYDDAVDLLVKAAALMNRMGRSAEFVSQLESLRLKYKRKRNFIKLLEQRRQSLYPR